MNIVLLVTFLCAIVWIYQCIQMYMRIYYKSRTG